MEQHPEIKQAAEKQLRLDQRYLAMARVWSLNSYCVRRQVGALMVKNKMIISDGYNGTPAGFENVCEEDGKTKPYVLHAEANAIISAARRDCIGATMYLSGREVSDGSYVKNASSCAMCKRLIINAGITTVIIRDDDENFRAIDVEEEWVKNDDSLGDELGY